MENYTNCIETKTFLKHWGDACNQIVASAPAPPGDESIMYKHHFAPPSTKESSVLQKLLPWSSWVHPHSTYVKGARYGLGASLCRWQRAVTHLWGRNSHFLQGLWGGAWCPSFVTTQAPLLDFLPYKIDSVSAYIWGINLCLVQHVNMLLKMF